MLVFLQIFVVAPFLASRAFLTTFVLALLARFGSDLDWLARSTGFQALEDAPTWFTHDLSLVVLGILAVVELGAEKSPELREFLHQIDAYIKGGVGLLTSLMLVDSSQVEVLDPLLKAGFSWEQLGALAGGLLTWFLARIRGRCFAHLGELDPDDDLGGQRWLSWIEDLWVFSGTLLVFLLPFLALAIAGLSVAGLLMVTRFLNAREQKRKQNCPDCGALCHRSAPHCHACNRVFPEPRRVGLFGLAKQEPAPAPPLHAVQLLRRTRCGHCGERLRKKGVAQTCGFCGRQAFERLEQLRLFLGDYRQRLPLALWICSGFGMIPLLGLAPGIIFYRLYFSAGLSSYMSRSMGCLARWSLRLANVLLVALQPVPLLGALVLPLLCWINYWVYRNMIWAQRKKLAMDSPDGI